MIQLKLISILIIGGNPEILPVTCILNHGNDLIKEAIKRLSWADEVGVEASLICYYKILNH